jgi:predicted dehydrogenase
LKVLIIGYGSIGKRHHEVLSSFQEVKSITIVTKQNLKQIKTYKKLEDIIDLYTYDYFIIASETKKHFEQLKYLEEKVFNKLIFCEKPLFETNKRLIIKKNKIFVGYVLRFHPLLQKLKDFIKDEECINVNVKCGQYLPTWRAGSDYRNSYSSKKKEGGGVLLDLSHEIDYVQWLFGKIDDIKSYQLKVSNLEIDSDDLTMLLGKTDKNIMINISIDYISKITHRKLLLDTLDNSYELDFILNKLIKKNKNDLEEVFLFKNLERNFMFEEMHKSILKENHYVCTYLEGMDVMKTISKIQGNN